LFGLFQDLILVPPFYHYEKRASLNRRKRFLPGSDTAPAEAEQNLKTSPAKRCVKGFFNVPKPVKGFEGKHRQRKSWIWILKIFGNLKIMPGQFGLFCCDFVRRCWEFILYDQKNVN
jgi:hypothetical protein